MKFFRAIALVLMLALTTSPALAAICAISCASQSIMSIGQSSDIATVENCHEESMGQENHQPSTKQDRCPMGAGCHFTQVTSPIIASQKIVFLDSNNLIFPKFVPSAKSVDLSPPLKPPA